MKTRAFRFRGKTYRIDYQGFLVDPKTWDRNFAEGMAEKAGIPGNLTEQHWRVIEFIRNTFDKMNECPLVYVACKKNDLGLGDLKKLFPTGYLRGACRLAGVTYRNAFTQHLWLEENAVHNTLVYDRKEYPCDVQGFLLNPDDWDENFAAHKAHELKMPDLLTGNHWEIVYFLRNRFKETGEVPTVYETCEANQLSLDELEWLFPDGYHRGAVKIAGLKVR